MVWESSKSTERLSWKQDPGSLDRERQEIPAQRTTKLSIPRSGGGCSALGLASGESKLHSETCVGETLSCLENQHLSHEGL